MERDEITYSLYADRLLIVLQILLHTLYVYIDKL